jgi:hypothetical protein
MGNRTRALIAAATIAAALSVPVAAWAQDGTDTDVRLGDDTLVVLNGRVLLPPGESVDGVVLFNGSARIEGTVFGDVVVFNGDTLIAGDIRGNVTVFNGTVDVAPTASITGDLVTGSAPNIDPAADILGETTRIDLEGTQIGLTIVSRIVWWIAASASVFLLGLLMLLLVPRAIDRLPLEFRQRTGATFAWGALLFVGLPALAIVALITLVGIPFGIGLGLALFAISGVGYTVATHIAGRLLVKEPKSRFLAFLVGFLIVRLVALVPILGGIAWVVLTVVGLGAIASAARRTERGGGDPLAQTIPVPPPPAPTG